MQKLVITASGDGYGRPFPEIARDVGNAPDSVKYRLPKECLAQMEIGVGKLSLASEVRRE